MLSDNDNSDLLLSCRYGDLEDVQAFLLKKGAAPLADIRDDNGNSVLHMTCANGHVGKHCTFFSRFDVLHSDMYSMIFRTSELPIAPRSTSALVGPK